MALTLKVHINGVRETLTALNHLPAEANQQLRERSRDLARSLAQDATAAARFEGRQARAVSDSVRVGRDRLPVVVAGGSKKVGRFRKPAYALLFGSEFGMNKRTGWYGNPRFAASVGRQYKPHLGRHSYWFFRQIEENQSEISRAWHKAADDIMDSFSRGDI